MQTFFSRLWADKRFRVSCAAAAILCWAAHGFAYANTTFLHDRYCYFLPISFDSVSRAKWMAQYWDYLTYFAYIPWLSGVLITIFFILSVYMIVKVLDVRRPWAIWLIAGICVTHSSVILAHMYWPTEILAALPLAAASAWCWKKTERPITWRMGMGAFFMGLSMASYGGYASVGPSLVIGALLLSLIDGGDWRELFRRGLEYVGTFLLGTVFYYAVLRLLLHIQNFELFAYYNENRLTEDFPGVGEILSLVVTAYQTTLRYFRDQRVLMLALFLGLVLIFARILRTGKKFFKPANLLLLAFLLGVLPLSVGLIYVLSFGSAHWLMLFGYALPLILLAALLDRAYEPGESGPKGALAWVEILLSAVGLAAFIAVVYKALPAGAYTLRHVHLALMAGLALYFLVPLVIAALPKKAGTERQEIRKHKRTFLHIPAFLLTVVLCVLAYRGVLTANLAYVKMDQIDTTTKSMTTRIMERIEACEGFEGTETLTFAGSVSSNPYLVFDDGRPEQEALFSELGTLYTDVGYTYASLLPVLLKTDSNNALPMAYYDAANYTPEEQELVAAMPVYPANDSVKKIGDTIVIKLSEE